MFLSFIFPYSHIIPNCDALYYVTIISSIFKIYYIFRYTYKIMNRYLRNQLARRYVYFYLSCSYRRQLMYINHKNEQKNSILNRNHSCLNRPSNKKINYLDQNRFIHLLLSKLCHRHINTQTRQTYNTSQISQEVEKYL